MTEHPKLPGRCFQAHETDRALALNGLPLREVLATPRWLFLRRNVRRADLGSPRICLAALSPPRTSHRFEMGFPRKRKYRRHAPLLGLGPTISANGSPARAFCPSPASAWVSGSPSSVPSGTAPPSSKVVWALLQFFWDRNRMCAQDRLAETIVVDTRRRSAPRPSPSEPDLRPV
jgi:hypothetical protein